MKKRHPARDESGIWTDAEKKYNAGKLECRRLLKTLKKFRYYLYAVRFLVEIDARTLVHQLNQPASDLPGSVVNRWRAWIRLFSFDIKHVAGKRHGGPDGLSRRGKDKGDSEDGEDENELEERIDADLAHAYTRVAGLNDTELGVAELDDGELDDANLTRMRVSGLADDTDDEGLADDADNEGLADDADDEGLADNADDEDLADDTDDEDLADDADEEGLADDADDEGLADNADDKDLADGVESEELAQDEDAKDAEHDEDEEHEEDDSDGDDEDDEDDVDDMPHDLKRIKGYLLTLQRPVGMTDRAFNSFRQYALRFLMHEGVLFRRAKQNMPPKRVIWGKNVQNDIIRQLHDESGHRGTKGTYEKAALRYWWKGLYRDIE